MKIAVLIIAIGLAIVSGIVCVGCLALHSTTNGRVSFEEAMMVFIPSAILFVVSLALTIVSALKSGKTAR